MAMERIDKLLSATGRWSRKEAKDLIRLGRVTSGGRSVRSGDEKLDPDVSGLEVDGADVGAARFYCYLLNKPAGVVSATSDNKEKTVIDLLAPAHSRQGLFPVGRLDKDTTGLLLLTNNGPLAHSILSPKSGIKKRYLARVSAPLGPSDVEAFREGLTLGDGTTCLPAGLALCPWDPTLGIATVCEGKYHQVKRMFAALGKSVQTLRRLSVGGLTLPPQLPPGQYLSLQDVDIQRIFDENFMEDDEKDFQLFAE